MKRDWTSMKQQENKKHKANKRECKENTVSICKMVINHALYFWTPFICWSVCKH